MAATGILLDSDPLVRFVNETVQIHRWSVKIWDTPCEPLCTCEAVLSEAIYLLQSDGVSIDTLLGLFERNLVKINFNVSSHQPDVWELLPK